MPNPLDNPLAALQDEAGGAPPWIWKGIGLGAGIGGAALARVVIDGARGRVSRRGKVPLNPADDRMSWPNALLWAGVIGIGAAIGRLFAQRAVAAAWTRRTHLPGRLAPSARS